jgi:hypothetical protein
MRPRVEDLIFQLYGRPLHPELFETMSLRKVQRDGYELTVRITRTGHVITWEDENVILTELMTAGNEPLPEKRRLLSYRMRGEHNGKLACAHDVHYQMSFQVETLAPEIFLHVQDEIIADGQKRGLLFNFQPKHRLTIAPVSFIAADARAGCLIFSSFHTFPEENTVVKSQSMIEKKQ